MLKLIGCKIREIPIAECKLHKRFAREVKKKIYFFVSHRSERTGSPSATAFLNYHTGEDSECSRSEPHGPDRPEDAVSRRRVGGTVAGSRISQGSGLHSSAFFLDFFLSFVLVPRHPLADTRYPRSRNFTCALSNGVVAQPVYATPTLALGRDETS